MQFKVEIKPQAQKDIRRLSKIDRRRILDAFVKLSDNLTGDVRRLTNFTPEYRLRVGDYRILFEVEDENCVVVYHVRHRREAYRE